MAENEGKITEVTMTKELSEEPKPADVDKQLLKSPEVLAALQDSFGPSPSEYIKSLPKCVRRRIKALKKLQAEHNKIESQFFEEVHHLECKYAAMYDPFFQRRQEIVSAQVEPTDAECDWPSDEESDLADQLKSKTKLEDTQVENVTTADENVRGIPGFWLTIFKNVTILSEMIQEHDEPILMHLQDVKLIMNLETGFRLDFTFEANEYFTNSILSKEYYYRFKVDESNPLGYEGPEIIRCTGTTMDWQKGKNVTIKLIKKVQKHKGRGTKRTITKTVQNDSFFNFFNPPQPVEGEEPDEDTEALLAADFEIGHFIRERAIPRAVLYFTGEALEDDDEGEYDDEDEGDENEDEDDGEDGDDEKPSGQPF